MRQAKIYNHNLFAGILTEDENGYTFQYNSDYIESHDAQAISLTLPLTQKPYIEKILFPFFDGLIPEGWLLDIALKSWKLNHRDRISLLLACCKDCIGSVSLEPIQNYEIAMKRCLYCYGVLADSETDFHPRCAKKIFGSTIAPILPYGKKQKIRR